MPSPEVHKLLAKAFGKGESNAFPAILQMLVGSGGAELLLSLPATPDELAAKFSTSPDEIRSILDRGFRRGLLVKREAPEGKTCYHLSGRATETILGDARNDRVAHEFLHQWQEYYEEFVDRLGPVEEPKMNARVLPVESMVGTAETILPFEKLRGILERAKRRVVIDCMCRKQAQNCDMPIRSMCFWLDEAADYFLSREVGREITVDRGMEIFWQAEKLGLVHLTDIILFENTPAKVGWICNCCNCCCALLKEVRRSKGTVGLMRSFRAEVNPFLCESCGLCGGVCYFGAFRFQEDGVPAIRADHCVGCGLCASRCAQKAIRLVRVDDPDVPEKTKRAIIHAIGE